MNKQYWTDSWKPDYSKFNHSGWKLLSQFRRNDKILDIGCGYNLFKQRLGDKVYGIDPYNNEADELVSWEAYEPKEKFNVYLFN